MHMARKLAAASLLIGTSLAYAQQSVTYPSKNANGSAVEVAATLTPAKAPAAGGRGPAVVLLHSKGGWRWPVTEQYARALSEAGFVVLEPRMFPNAASAPAPLSVLPMVYDALKYLATRDGVDGKRIGVAGFSYGGSLSLHAAAAWAQAAYAGNPELKFAAHAPFYPVCWTFSAFAQGKRKTSGLPVDAFTQWTGSPVKIFAGALDDYDDRDPNTCAEFVSHLPADAQKQFSVVVYADATHGWDQRDAEFYEKFACKGKGCTNRNIANPKFTQQGIADLVAFFAAALR